MRMPEIVWESYHSDGRPRNTPLPSTVHGWLTKMRGTLLDDEAIRYRGIKEMKQAAAVRIDREKEEAERKLRNLARTNAGRSPLQPAGKQPWLRLSFLHSPPKPIVRGSTRPVATARKLTSAHTQKRIPPSSSPRPRHNSTSGNRRSKRHPSHVSHASRRSSKDRPQPIVRGYTRPTVITPESPSSSSPLNLPKPIIHGSARPTATTPESPSSPTSSFSKSRYSSSSGNRSPKRAFDYTPIRDQYQSMSAVTSKDTSGVRTSLDTFRR
ncbi:hypothetical protein BDM02DRAFT_3127254 [Thelephora ganbajun]|uniref:Uncharacterized protein n=1 Tax=Thelephora ganbajun TaxID=370292 RepID=A0ACB6ZNY1_THEGA|nr:hypothetical protein BDM02DRAFT_3127254 [Thelephora ganbajun]